MSGETGKAPYDASAVRRRLILRVVRWILLAAVLYFVGRALVVRLADVEWSTLHVSFLYLVPAAALLIVGTHVTPTVYRLLLPAACRPPWRTMCAITWSVRPAKYLPGKFATAVGQVWLLYERKVSVVEGTTATLVGHGFIMVVGLIVAVPLFFWEPLAPYLAVPGWLVVLLSAALLVCLHPKVFLGLGSVLLRLFRLPPLQGSRRLRDYLLPLGLVLAGYFLAGCILWLLICSVVPVSFTWYPIFVSTFGAAAALGLLAFFAPAGIGVREGIYLVILEQIIPAGDAAVVVILLRLLQTFVELVMAAVGVLYLKRTAGRLEIDGEAV